MKKLISWLDPHKQSCLFFDWHFSTVFVLGLVAVLLTVFWNRALPDAIFSNSFVYLPNYLTHEMAGHNFVGAIFLRALYSTAPQLGRWLHILAGSGVETLVPFCLLVGALRLRGGRWFLPPILYWFSTAMYSAGRYAADARACSLPLTSSDMVTNYKPGEICGDWRHILEPIGLLNFDQVIAHIFIFIGCVAFVIAVYSVWYYWTHAEQNFQQHCPIVRTPIDDWVPPGEQIPQQSNPPDKQTPQQSNPPGSRNY